MEIVGQPLYQAMTRPATILGVRLEWFLFSIVVGFMSFMHTKSLPAMLVALPVHGLGMLIQRSDPHFMSLWITYLIKVRPSHTSKFQYGGTATYDP